MFRIFWAVLGLMLSFGAAADSPRFTVIDNLFNQGITFDFAIKTGWHAGRCFSPNSNNAIPAVIVVEEKMPHGPAFARERKFVILQFSGEHHLDRFDNLSDSDRAGIRKTVDHMWDSIVAVPGPDLTTTLNNTQYQMRLSNDTVYLAARVSSLANGQYVACYFFKWLT